MKTLLLPSLVLVTLLPALAPTETAAETAAEGAARARAIMEQVEDRPDGTDSTARTRIAITDRFGQTYAVEILRLRRDFGPEGRDQYTFSFITGPEDMAGTRVLTRDYIDPDVTDDQWIMIPGIDEVKRIAVDSYTSKRMGSDINYGDLAARDLDRYDFTLEGEEKVGDWTTTVITFTPRTQEEIDRFGYVRGKVWVDMESFLVVRSIFDMVQPGQSKLFMTHATAFVDGYWTPTDMTFITQIDGNVSSSTRMTLDAVQFDTGISADLFEPGALVTYASTEMLPVSY